MKSKKNVTNYSNVTEYTRNKIDLDIDKVNKIIDRLEDWIFHYQDTLSDKKQELVDNLKRFN